jgi:hypothetical protein
MTSRTRKLVHAGVVALAAVFADVGAQLYSGAVVSLTRAAIVGLAMGAVARVVGAVLAAGWLDSSDGGSA